LNMKNFLLVITLLTFTTLKLSAQWSTDPNNNLIIATGWDPHIVADSAGGCYITYNYESFYPQKLAVERLDKYGYKPWGNKKQILGELPEQWQAEIIEDGEGGVIISYEDNEVIGTGYITRVRVQRVDSDGNFLWGQTGVRVSVEEKTHGAQVLVNDGDGGCVILWQDNIGQYYINRIIAEGERVWGDSGRVIGTSAYTGMWLIRASDLNYYAQTGEYIYRIRNSGEITRRDSVTFGVPVPDPEGGIVISNKIWTGIIPKLVSQRKDSLGNNLWQEPYIEIADSLYINSPINILPINRYYFYNWYGRKNGVDLVTQYQALRLDGTKLFSQGSLPISNYPVDALIGNILPSDSGTFVSIWQDYRPNDGVFGQRKDTLNNILWDSSDVPLYNGMYSDLFATTDGRGGAIGLGWHQFDFSIRSFKVSKNGILGEVITNINDQHNFIFKDEIVLYQNFPNPFNSSTIIQFQLAQESKIRIDLYNILGEKIQTISDGFYSRGMHSINLSSFKLPSGIYVYRLQTETKSITKKLLIIK
jgi:hypothetical protein